jgi:hypothetical protein
MAENPPKAVKEANGDITVHLEGITDAIEAEWKKIIEPRDTKRSLVKRYTMQEIVERAQRVMRLAQVGGAGDQIVFISPVDFPRPKNEPFISAMEDDKKYAEKVYLGRGPPDDARNNLGVLSSWLSFGSVVGHLDFKDGKMVFPSSFLDSQEELPQGNGCAEKGNRPFCANCGGNAAAITPEAITGKCVGIGDGEQKEKQG